MAETPYQVAPRSARRVSLFSALLRRLAREHAERHAPEPDSGETPIEVTTMAEVEAVEREGTASGGTFTASDLLDRLVEGPLLGELVQIVLVTDSGQSAPVELADSDALSSDLLAEAYAAFSTSSTTLMRAVVA